MFAHSLSCISRQVFKLAVAGAKDPGEPVQARWFRRAAARSDCSSGVGFSFLVCSVEWHLQAVLPGAYLSPTSTTAAPSVVAPAIAIREDSRMTTVLILQFRSKDCTQPLESEMTRPKVRHKCQRSLSMLAVEQNYGVKGVMRYAFELCRLLGVAGNRTKKPRVNCASEPASRQGSQLVRAASCSAEGLASRVSAQFSEAPAPRLKCTRMRRAPTRSYAQGGPRQEMQSRTLAVSIKHPKSKAS